MESSGILRVVVAAALVDLRGRVLACCRRGPSALAGGWEFPGGKVEPGEDEVTALVRECREELGVGIEVGAILGEVPLPADGWVLRVRFGRIVEGEPRLITHSAHRWLARHELDDVPWLAPDAPLIEDLRRCLGVGALDT
ncbi:(deoxy)nucleoside triphosphate pyrophosphohydrolase [Candidatus Protofrankia californiensis]|uniref:(deoxy)nucleoside triphosphate pyrophosphohydrolase n=1 Tax=Candidatus Protofrankia californiensis TaxID=1839754 RepID=UPI0010416C47|nr:(deoxy)nucleoside triphosphate pyrophosphohydrolase [Candidatus Protofrankia californiensis]